MSILGVFNFQKDGLLKIIGLFLTLSSIAGFFSSALLYNVSLLLFGIILVMSVFGKGLVIDGSVIFFLVICILSLVVNKPPAFFNAWVRLGFYILVLFVVGPVISCCSTNIIRRKLLTYVMDVCIILSVLSFFCYFLDINLFLSSDEHEYLDIAVGSFSGLMKHSMILGPISGLSAIVLLSICLCEKKKLRRYMEIVPFLCCICACLLSSSRLAVAATIVGCIFVIYCRYRGNLTKFASTLLVVGAIGGLTFPIWGGVTEFLAIKQEYNLESGGSFLYSRENKINARFSEIESSPIFGIGFATVNPAIDAVNVSNGQIEPGSSWLAIMSMTGLLGFTAFLSICFITIKRLKVIISHNDVFYFGMLGGMFTFFLIHMLAEGYIMAPRSFLNMLFWLILGAINEESKAVTL